MCHKAKPYEITMRERRGQKLYGFRILNMTAASRTPWTPVRQQAIAIAERVAYRSRGARR